MTLLDRKNRYQEQQMVHRTSKVELRAKATPVIQNVVFTPPVTSDIANELDSIMARIHQSASIRPKSAPTRK